jgi:hypothetical protein
LHSKGGRRIFETQIFSICAKKTENLGFKNVENVVLEEIHTKGETVFRFL